MTEPIHGHTASGKPLTDHDVQRLADEAERGYDVGRARRLQQMLTRRHEAQGQVSAEEMLEQMRSRRPSSRRDALADE